jgi:dipeptidyl aminopeptidase/acylaminoacyl peptidase
LRCWRTWSCCWPPRLPTLTETARYGAWRTPISPPLVAEAGRRLASAVLAGDGAVWWAEGRPAEGGRVVLMRRDPGAAIAEVTPAEFYARTRVHEYGGGAWCLHGDDAAIFVNLTDQRLYRQALGKEPRALTPKPDSPAALRYADMRVIAGGTALVCVREVHGEGEAENEIVSIPLDGSGEAAVLAAGRDFYSFPRPSPDGRQLAWTCWDHPNMPWDGTELWLAPLDDPAAARLIAGGPAESVFQPEWSPAGVLHFASDRDGWWNLQRLGDDGSVAALTAEKAELAHPQWLFGAAAFAFLDDGAIACVRNDGGAERLGVLRPGAEAVEDLGLPFASFGYPSLSSRGSRVAFAASSPERETVIAVHDLGSGETEIVREASESAIDPAYISVPRAIEFPSSGGAHAHAFFYPPANAEFEAPEGELPPLIVQSHGGPTSHATPALDREILFWTSRGIGVVDVNYRGSSGFGRPYREALNGTWGIVDTDDCIAAAKHLAAAGEADGERLAIHGGSAGGYSTLCALTFHDEFATGASYYGVADAETLAQDTHKFESRYLDGLIGPYPEAAEIYRERSPIHHVERLRAPVILFQGLEDEIVPPNQAETMVAALKQNGIPHAYLAFEGEQHGFRRAETEIRCLEAELYFYGRILGFDPADDLKPVEIVE